jgi:hypothetical protein
VTWRGEDSSNNSAGMLSDQSCTEWTCTREAQPNQVCRRQLWMYVCLANWSRDRRREGPRLLAGYIFMSPRSAASLPGQ